MLKLRSAESPAEAPAETPKQSPFMEKQLFEKRVLTLFGEIDMTLAQSITEKLLALSYQSNEPITLFIGSPGGHVESGDTIFDMIRFIEPVVRIVGTGWVGSAAAHVYLSTPKEHRYCLPNTRFLLHQPAGGFGGTASDVEIHAREILKIRARINRIISEETGQPLEKIERDTDRDYWMEAKESVEYGLVGRIINSQADLP